MSQTNSQLDNSNIVTENFSSDSDDGDQLSKNTELFNAIRKKPKKGQDISEESRLKEIDECLKNRAEINAVDKNDRDNTVLHIAVKKHYEKIVKYLLQKPEIDTHIRNTDEKRARDLAEDSNNQNIIRWFDQQEILCKKKLTNDNKNIIAERTVPGTEGIRIKIQEKGNKRKPRCEFSDDDVAPQKMQCFLDNLTMPSEGIKLAEHGNIFQLKLLMLCLWNIVHTEGKDQMKGEEFRLATEMPEAEKFDDIVFQYKNKNANKWKFRLLQAKHKEGKTLSDPLLKIKLADLLSTNDDEAFSLQKYFHSYLKIKRRSEENSLYSVFSDSEIEDVIIITNIDFYSDEERSIFVKNTKNIKEDILLKTDKKDTFVYKLRVKENKTVINKLKIIFENHSDFHKLVESLAQNISNNMTIDKTNIFKEYYYPLVNEIFKINIQGTGKEKKYFINLDNFVEGKRLNGEELSEEASKIRDALIKEMVFRKGKVTISEIDKSFGNSDLSDDETELNNLAEKVAEFIQAEKTFTVNDFEKYHIALEHNVLDIKNKKLNSKFIQESVDPHKYERSKLGTFKYYFLKSYSILRTKLSQKDLKQLKINISEDFGRSKLVSDKNVLKTLAENLVKSIKQNKKLSVEDFQTAHIGLAKEVIDTETQTFHNIFINGQEKIQNKMKELSPEAKMFRRILIDEIYNQNVKIRIENQEVPMKKLDILALHSLLSSSSKIKVSVGFATGFKPEKNPEINNANLFAIQMKKLINNSSQDEEKVIEINNGLIKTILNLNNDKEFSTFNDNVKNIAGYVLIGRFDKIRFSTRFLKSDNLPININKFKKHLKHLLGNDLFESLFEYEFKFDKEYKTCEDGELDRKLPIMHNDRDVNDFFEKLKIIVNYPNRIEISDLLGAEIKDQLKILDSEVFQSNYYKNLHNWMADRIGTFYTTIKIKKLFHQIQDNLLLWTIDGFNKPYFADTSQEYYFRKYNILDEFLSSNKQILHLDFQDIFLGHTRVVQTFQELQVTDDVNIRRYTRKFGHIFLYLKQLDDKGFRLKIYKVLKKLLKFNLVVIECNTQLKEIAELYNKLDGVLKSSDNKKVILITSQKYNDLAKKFATALKYKSVLDKSSFDDLTKESQQKLLEQDVILQGKKTSLIELIHNSNEKTRQIIDSETLAKIIKGDTISIGCDLKDLGEVNDYYIFRRFNTQVTFNKANIKKDFTKSNIKSDLFVISGTNSGLQDINNIYVFDNDELAGYKFQKLCDRNEESNIHWLKSNSEELIWYKSYGSIANIVKYKKINEGNRSNNLKSSDIIEEVKLLHKANQQKIIIISDTAGMGKTTVLTSLSMELKKDSSLWVIRINLNDYTKIFQQEIDNKNSSISKCITKDINKVVNFFLNDLLPLQPQLNLKSNLEKELFKNSFINHGKIALLFDGVDEISPDYNEIVINLLQSLKESKVEKLFITTRPNMSEELERKLEVFAHVLEPLSKEEQIEFLIKFWTKKLKLKNLEQKYTERLKMYAVCIIEHIYKSINYKEQEFIGIPLQTRMLAEVFQENRERLPSVWQGCKEFLKSENDKPNFLEVFDVLDLYDYFIKVKFYKSNLEEKKGRDFTKIGEKRSADENYKIFKEKHAILALHTLLSAEDIANLISQEEILNLTSLIENIKRAEYNEGIVDQIIDDKPHFLHRTFAEYLASFRITEKMLESPVRTLECIDKLLLNTSPIFINSIIKQLDGKQEKITSLLEKPLLYFVIIQNHSNFLKSLLKLSYIDWVQKLDASSKTPLHYVIENNRFDMVKELLHYANDMNEKDILKHGSFKKPEYENSRLVKFINIQDGFGETALHYALQKNNMDLAFKLLFKGANIDSLTDIYIDKLIHWMLHHEDSNIYNTGILSVYADQENKYRSIEEKLLLKAPNILNTLEDMKDQSRILSYFFLHGRINVIKALLETIDDLTKRKQLLQNDDNSYTPLDRVNVSNKLKDDDRLEITKCLFDEGGFITNLDVGISNYKESDDKSYTRILQAAARHGHVKTLKYFIIGEDPDYYWLHVYQAALYNQYNIIKYLFENHRDKIKKDGNTVLHTACDAPSNLKTIESIINSDGELINATNNDGETPLFMAIYADSGLNLIEYLITRGADFNAENKYHDTPLSSALHRNQVDVIKYLLEKDARISKNASELIKNKLEIYKNRQKYNIDLIDRNGSTRLHSAINSGNFELAKFLIEQGADVNKIDIQGKTPLHCASALKQVEIVELLLQYGAIFNKTDNNNNTPRDLISVTGDNDNKIIWLLNVLSQLFKSQNLIKDLNEQLLEPESSSSLKDWGTYGRGLPDAYDGNNPTLFILNTRNIQGKTLLHIASDLGDVKAMHILYTFNYDYLKRKERESWRCPRYQHYQSISIDAKDFEGNTPLHLAAEKGHDRIVTFLLTEGAIFNGKNLQGKTPEVLATNNNHNYIVKLFQCVRSLFTAVEENNLLKVESCFNEEFINVIKVKNEKGRTPLHLAASSSRFDVVQILLEKNIPDVNAIDLNKNTPLHIAAENDKIENVKLLLKYSAIYNSKNNQDHRPLDLAHGQSYQLLEQIDALFKNIKGCNPQIKINAIETIQKTYKIDSNTILSTCDEQLNTLLHYAANFCEFDVVEFLLENGACFNSRNKLNETPKDLTSDPKIDTLLRAIQNMFDDIDNIYQEREIVNMKIITNVRNAGGMGLLSLAEKFNKLDIINWIREHGNDVNI